MYSQKDNRWGKEQLGTCRDTIAQSGCYITSGCNLASVLGTCETNPSKLNKWLIQNAGYVQGCLLVTPKMAEYLGLVYKGKVNYTNVRYCIAETDHYRKYGVPQHFFVIDTASGKRLDPLDLNPTWEPNDYHIVSYRVFSTPPQSTKIVEEVKDPGIATTIPVMGETTTTVIPVQNVSDTPKIDVGEAIAKPIVVPTKFEQFIELLAKVIKYITRKR